MELERPDVQDEKTVETKKRRKGNPLKGKEVPLKIYVLRMMVSLSLGLLIIFLVYLFFSRAKEIIRFSYDEAQLIAHFASEDIAEDKEAADFVRKVSQVVPSGEWRETVSYKADEQVVALSRYDHIAAEPEYSKLNEKLNAVKSTCKYVDDLYIVIYDPESELSLVAASSGGSLPVGNMLRIEGWEKDDIYHTAHALLDGWMDGDGSDAYVVAYFGSEGLFEREFRGLIPTIIISLLVMIALSAKVYVRFMNEEKKSEEKSE